MGYTLVLVLLAVAFLLVTVGTLILLLATLKAGLRREHRSDVGAVLILGPIPLVFGTNERVARNLILLAIGLTLVTFLVFIALNWRFNW